MRQRRCSYPTRLPCRRKDGPRPSIRVSRRIAAAGHVGRSRFRLPRRRQPASSAYWQSLTDTWAAGVPEARGRTCAGERLSRGKHSVLLTCEVERSRLWSRRPEAASHWHSGGHWLAHSRYATRRSAHSLAQTDGETRVAGPASAPRLSCAAGVTARSASRGRPPGAPLPRLGGSAGLRRSLPHRNYVTPPPPPPQQQPLGAAQHLPSAHPPPPPPPPPPHPAATAARAGTPRPSSRCTAGPQA
ncbi:uncharacterized protein LOC126484663 [Schistocerca serialis cubense]|uniref:uncharacterized protein LOC126484663 n=1 Tax=Schistocerca serialis cubense TaxID=2023355 RepID=UPI00214F4697|nr:uncharacterized protein LOC126484663 [Schistocerca serialis cubense]